MPDQLDVVRELFAALNRADVGTLERLYDADCIAEHVFLDDESVVVGRDEVCRRWRAEFARVGGALAGGHRFDLRRVAGIETGWGWVRAEWRAAVRDLTGGAERFLAGHSHFWVEGGTVQRHRTVMRPVDSVAFDALAAAPDRSIHSRRDYPDRPVVGVGAVIVAADGRVVLVKRRYEPLAGQWSLPGGALDVGETLEAGTAREVLEETGLVVDVGPVVEVFDRILVDDAGDVRYHFVLVDSLCRPREPGRAPRAGSDVSDVALVAPADLAGYRLAEKAGDVIRKALALANGGPASPD